MTTAGHGADYHNDHDDIVVKKIILTRGMRVQASSFLLLI